MSLSDIMSALYASGYDPIQRSFGHNYLILPIRTWEWIQSIRPWKNKGNTRCRRSRLYRRDRRAYWKALSC